jgi:PAS domain S-box-containing protein
VFYLLTAQTFNLQEAKTIFNKYSILIVEDDLTILQNFKDTLSHLFKNVYTSTNGVEALELYNLYKDDLSIIMADYHMPLMNGLDLFTAIRSENRNIALMLATGDMSKEIFLKAIKIKLDEFVIKPIQFKTLLVLIYQILLRIEQDKAFHKQKKDLEILFKLLGQHNLITKSDLQGNITYANDIFCEVSGYSKDEVIGQPHSIVRHPDMKESVFKNMWETITAGEIWRGRVKNKAKDGRFYIVNAMIMPIFDKTGTIQEYISSRHIVTDEVEENEKFNEFNKHLKKNVIDLKSQTIKVKNELENNYQIKLQTTLQMEYQKFQNIQDNLTDQILRLKEKNAMLLSNLDLREKELQQVSNRQGDFYQKQKEKAQQEADKAKALEKELELLQNEHMELKKNFEDTNNLFLGARADLEKAKGRIKELEDVVKHYDMAKKLEAIDKS